MLNINTVNPLGIGTFLIGGGYHRELKRDFADYSKDEEAIAAIRYSIEKGQNHIDTAYSYSDGHSEELVGEAIKGIDRSAVFIADKLSKGHMLRNAVIPCVKIMLARLQTDYIDLLYAHTPNVPEEMSEYILGMNDAIDAGLVRYIAVSNFDEQQLVEAMKISKHPIVANQIQMNVFDRTRSPESLLDFCTKAGIRIVAYQPLRNKVFFPKINDERILKIVKSHGKTESQVALNWLIKGRGVIAIPKALNKSHIDENIASLDFELTSEEINIMNEIGSIE